MKLPLIPGVEPFHVDEKAGIVLYCGDCRELLPLIPKGMVDLVLTDPPYGIGEARGKNKSRSVLAESKDYGDGDWDDETCEAGVQAAIALSRVGMVFGGNYYDLPPSPCWLVWDKENGDNDFADCELIWTNLPGAVRIKRHRWHGMLRKDNEPRFHPTQKPLDVVRWAMRKDDGVGVVLDGFAGVGTTLVAAKLEGRPAVGIELREDYCEIAKRRLIAARPGFVKPGTLKPRKSKPAGFLP